MFLSAQIQAISTEMREKRIRVNIEKGREECLKKVVESNSCILNLQDMAPLEELERMRAGFLAMVSHELRSPLAAVKGSAVTVLSNAADHMTA